MRTSQIRKHVYVIHGYNATPKSHWFPWIKDRLSERGATVDILELPNSQSPNLTEWTEHLSQHASELDGGTYFIAHSLGCVSLLRYLEQAELKEKIGGFLLVSGFSKSLPELRFLDEFTRAPLDYGSIVDAARYRMVLASKDDPIVPFSYSKELSERILADFYPVDGCGHFLGIEGFTTLPIVYDLMSKAMGLDSRRS